MAGIKEQPKLVEALGTDVLPVDYGGTAEQCAAIE